MKRSPPLILAAIIGFQTMGVLASAIPRFSRNDKKWMEQLIESINGALYEADQKNGSTDLGKFKVFSHYALYYVQVWALPKIAEKAALLSEATNERSRDEVNTQIRYLVRYMRQHFGLDWDESQSAEQNINRYGVFLSRDESGKIKRDDNGSPALLWNVDKLNFLANKIEATLNENFSESRKSFEAFRDDAIASLRKIQSYL